MITLEEILNEGPFLVKGKVTKAIFMISAVKATGGAIGVCAYEQDEERPAAGKHLMLSVNARENYFSKLDRIKNTIP